MFSFFKTQKYRKTLKKAIRNGDVSIVKDTLNLWGIENINKTIGEYCNTGNFYSSLFFAIQYNKIEIVELLISLGADVNYCLNENTSPMFFAAKNGYSEIVSLLHQHGADPNICKTSTGCGPLHIAAINGHTECAKRLLDMGVDINKQSLCNATPAIYAAGCENYETLQLFIEYGCDINIEANDGETVLYLTVRYDNIDFAKELIEKGADVDKAIRHALDVDDEETYDILRDITNPERTKNQVEIPKQLPNHLQDILTDIFKNSTTKVSCAICLENIESDIRITKCGHIYHNECIEIWENQKHKCPTCKTRLD